MTNPWKLSPRQAQALTLLVSDGCNKKIARGMALSVRTVEIHLSDALKRMGVENRVLAAVAWDRWARANQ